MSEDNISGITFTGSTVQHPIKRVTSTTGKLRWLNLRDAPEARLVLQQEFVEQDEMWIDWKGSNPKFYWQDVPVEEENG